MVLQNPTVCKSGVYESVRDCVIHVAQQRSQLLKPSPMDVGNVDSGLNWCGSYWGVAVRRVAREVAWGRGLRMWGLSRKLMKGSIR